MIKLTQKCAPYVLALKKFKESTKINRLTQIRPLWKNFGTGKVQRKHNDQTEKNGALYVLVLKK